MKKGLILAFLASLILLIGCSKANNNQTGEAEANAAPADAAAMVDQLSLHDAATMTDVDMLGIDGEMHTLRSVMGEKGTLVIFTCNHCPYVQAWQERLVPLANAAVDEGIGVIAINSNDPKDYPIDGMEGMKERASAMGMKYPYVVDRGSLIARAFKATRTPEIYLFDADGTLVYQGAVDDNAQDPSSVSEAYLADALNALANGQEISTSRTRSVGCTIKYWPEATDEM